MGYSHIYRALPQYVSPTSPAYPWVLGAVETFGYIVISQWLVFVLGLFYIGFALRYWRVSKFAPVLLGFNIPAMILPLVVLFMSMAGTPRYTFFGIVMIHASHLFAIGLYRERQKLKIQHNM